MLSISVSNPCDSQPCLNGDECRPTATGFECCFRGFGGFLRCQPLPGKYLPENSWEMWAGF